LPFVRRCSIFALDPLQSSWTAARNPPSCAGDYMLLLLRVPGAERNKQECTPCEARSSKPPSKGLWPHAIQRSSSLCKSSVNVAAKRKFLACGDKTNRKR
jgi:hypothetical protein